MKVTTLTSLISTLTLFPDTFLTRSSNLYHLQDNALGMPTDPSPLLMKARGRRQRMAGKGARPARCEIIEWMPGIVPPQATDGISPITFGRNPLPKDPSFVAKKECMDYATHDFEVWEITPTSD